MKIEVLESELAEMGYGSDYVQRIRKKVTKGQTNAGSMNAYRAALERTLRSKKAGLTVPF